MSSSTMRFTAASGRGPSTPRPVTIQTRRSSFATRTSTPSSMPFRPSFHSSYTRTPYWAGVSSSVVGSISTAIWLPLPRSKSRSRASRVWICGGVSVPVRSVTRALSGGTATSARAQAKPARRTPAARRPSQRPRMQGLPLRRRGGLAEIDRRRLGDGLFVLDTEARLHRVAEQHRRQVDRELAYEHVVSLYGFYVAVARDGNAVLRALELRLQVAEIRVRLELGIVLGDEQEPRESARHSRLRLLEAPERRFVVEELGRRVGAADPRARRRDVDQHLLFLRRESLDRVDEVGNQVGAPLILIEDLRPGRLDLFVVSLDVVVAAARQPRRDQDNERCT